MNMMVATIGKCRHGYKDGRTLWILVNLFNDCHTFVGGVSPPLLRVGPLVKGFWLFVEYRGGYVFPIRITNKLDR